ncbi:hypothetical protein DP114_09680 [Brasilonema sennae CENA114]|uniref:Uncharacterized protein n=2 Tax=Brasilonema TaxID=383614 RepID=A0A856MAB0_9CYAN|nr:hypothetical protein [Brasilonema octagenarum UFV-OR1]QDL08135.1 hypothetical protein DP114_09680 [Brasilonema sennae CENA114]
MERTKQFKIKSMALCLGHRLTLYVPSYLLERGYVYAYDTFCVYTIKIDKLMLGSIVVVFLLQIKFATMIS